MEYLKLPMKVIIDKNISDKSKFLLALISSLSQKEGYCWAKNDYFAETLDTSVRTIERNINELKQYGYIECEYKYDMENKKNKRMRIRPTKLSLVPDKIVAKVPDKNGGVNITSINRVSNSNIYPFSKTKSNIEPMKYTQVNELDLESLYE